MGIVPDKVLLLDNKRKALIYQTTKNLQEAGIELAGERLQRKVEGMHQEYELQFKGVREIFKNFITEIQINMREP